MKSSDPKRCVERTYKGQKADVSNFHISRNYLLCGVQAIKEIIKVSKSTLTDNDCTPIKKFVPYSAVNLIKVHLYIRFFLL